MGRPFMPVKHVLTFMIATSTVAILAQSTPVFQSNVANVPVDVVVTNPQNLPVDGLSRDSFTILEDGKPQQIISFEGHSPANATAAQLPTLPRGVYSNAPTLGDNSVDVLLIDALNTPTTGQLEAYKKLLSYLKETLAARDGPYPLRAIAFCWAIQRGCALPQRR